MIRLFILHEGNIYDPDNETVSASDLVLPLHPDWDLYADYSEAWTNGWKLLTKPYAWNGGTSYNHPSGSPSATHCVPESPNDHFIKSTTSASTFSIGYTAPILNFGGSARTGYSGTASTRFGFGQNGQLCGIKGAPADSPGVMVAAS